MKHKNQQGQSTIEFIFTFTFAVSTVLLIFNSAMNYAAGYLAHYATFMASRVYLTAESYSGNYGTADASFRQVAERDARETFEQYKLTIFDIPNDAFQINHASMNNSASDYLMVGGHTTFQRNIDALGKLAGQSKLDLVSESFLGKEPTRVVCATRICQAITGSQDCTSFDVTLFDDGC